MWPPELCVQLKHIEDKHHPLIQDALEDSDARRCVLLLRCRHSFLCLLVCIYNFFIAANLTHFRLFQNMIPPSATTQLLDDDDAIPHCPSVSQFHTVLLCASLILIIVHCIGYTKILNFVALTYLNFSISKSLIVWLVYILTWLLGWLLNHLAFLVNSPAYFYY